MTTSIGKDTFGLTKGEYNEKISRIITNHRANSKLIAEPRELVLRSCRLTERWSKLSNDAEVEVYLRYVEIAGNRKVKMLSLERGATRQPVPKGKLIEELYPSKKIATSASLEEKHYNSVKAAMRFAVNSQLKDFRNSISLPSVCYLSGMKIRKGMKTDVDHVGVTFSEIADSFVCMKNLRYTDITLIGPPTAKKFKDAVLWKEWQEYHLQKASFALVCASANRSKGSDGYQTPVELYGSFLATSPEELSLDF
jgi:hypothetical protein